MMKLVIVSLCLSLNVYAAATATPKAAPAKTPVPATMAKACANEIKKFCAKEKGETNVYNCLEKHDPEMSKSCDAAHEAYGIANGLEKKDK